MPHARPARVSVFAFATVLALSACAGDGDSKGTNASGDKAPPASSASATANTAEAVLKKADAYQSSRDTGDVTVKAGGTFADKTGAPAVVEIDVRYKSSGIKEKPGAPGMLGFEGQMKLNGQGGDLLKTVVFAERAGDGYTTYTQSLGTWEKKAKSVDEVKKELMDPLSPQPISGVFDQLSAVRLTDSGDTWTLTGPCNPERLVKLANLQSMLADASFTDPGTVTVVVNKDGAPVSAVGEPKAKGAQDPQAYPVKIDIRFAQGEQVQIPAEAKAAK